MDHAEVLERLETAMVSPGKLRALEADGSPDGIELRRHLEHCDMCAREYRAWWQTAHVLDAATPDSLRAPAEARGRVLAAVVASPQEAVQPSEVAVPADTGLAPAYEPSPIAESVSAADPSADATVIPFRPRAVPGPVWIAVAAAAAVLLFVLGAFIGGMLGFAPDEPDDTVPVEVAQTADRIIREPDHQTVTLVDAAGQPAGSLLFDPGTNELVVLADELTPPSSGESYDCYLERDGERVQIGRMQGADGLSYWAGPIDDPSDAGLPGDRFVVALDETDSRPILTGAF